MDTQNISQISNLYQLIAYLIISFTTIGLPVIIKSSKDLKKRKNIAENTTLTLEKISDKLDNQEKNINYLIDITKDNVFLDKIQIQLITLINRIIATKNFQNKELSDVLKHSVSELVKLMKLILSMNFEFDDRKLQENFYFFLRKIKHGVLIDRLELSNSIDFLETLQNNVIIPEIDKFILDFPNYKNKLNGLRREAFGNAITELVGNICMNSIINYNSYKR